MSACLIVASFAASAQGCASDWDCSLNGLCSDGACVCDVPWFGTSCEQLRMAPGVAVGVGGEPLCAFRGGGNATSSWGGSVLHAPEDGLFYMWAARMTNECSLDQWQTK